jgi:arylsulfatase A-like enzyme
MDYETMKQALSLTLLTALLPLVLLATNAARADDQRPNVVFIIVDDLNDLPLAPLGKPEIATPNIDRLAERGVSFTNAHTNDPICAPARAAMMFGLYPQTTGLYWFENWRQNEILNKSVSLNRHLKNNGYSVFGTGKVYHIGRGDNAFDEFGYRTEFGPWPWDGKGGQVFWPHPAMMYMYETDGDMAYKWEHHFGRLSMVPEWPADEANGVPGYKGWRLYGKPFRYVNSKDRDPLADELCADWSTEIIERAQEKPYALFTGFVRTHTPLYAPDEYFDRFPLDSIEIPETIENDLEDCAEVLADRSLYGFRRYTMLVRHKDRELYKEWLQAYLACVSFVDDQVGKILDAVDTSPQRDNTIVILTSDHGFHMGEKEFLYKQSLWGGATRVPLIVAGLEGMPEGATCDQPVSLIDIYPTINDLCDLPTDPNADGNGYQLEGHSLLPLLTNPEGGWTGPDVAITALPGKDHSQHNRHQGTWFPHFSVRSKQFRYTLCANGEEELYDYEADPLEWKNLANDPAYTGSKTTLKAQLIELRDGPNWQTLDSLKQWTYGAYKGGAKEVGDELHFAGGKSFYLATIKKFQNLELQFKLKSPNADRLRVSYHAAIDQGRISGTVAATPPAPSNLEGEPVEFRAGDWNRYRIRVLGDRCRVWINERLHSDVREPVGPQHGVIGIDFTGAETPSVQLRQSRIRPL